MTQTVEKEREELLAMTPEQAITWLEQKKPGLLEGQVFRELKESINDYPSGLASKQYCQWIISDIETIKNPDDQAAAKRTFVRAALNLVEGGEAGKVFFLDPKNIQRAFPHTEHSEFDPRAHSKDMELRSKSDRWKAAGPILTAVGAIGMIGGTIGMVRTAMAAPKPEPKITHVDDQGRTVRSSGPKEHGLVASILLFLASAAFAAGGVYMIRGAQADEVAANLLTTLNAPLEAELGAINARNR